MNNIVYIVIIIILIIALCGFGYHSKDFRLDASSETLLIEGDPDLKYLQEISKKYGSKEFLILTYTPKEGMISNVSINNLLSLKYKIQSLEWVHNVVTLLDIPLLDNSIDYIMSIAVIHHLSTSNRRLASLKEIYRVLKIGGRALIYAWAKEQPKFKNETKQDVFVKWNLQKKYNWILSYTYL